MNTAPVHHIASVLASIRFHGLDIEFSPERLAIRVTAKAGTPWGYDNVTGVAMAWKGRWWLLSVHMVDGEIVQTAFKAILTALEHECRERFTYKGARVFDPHLDIARLVDLAATPDGFKARE